MECTDLQLMMVEWTFFISLGDFLLVGGIVFFGQLIYAALGFGAGMVTVGLLSLLHGDLKLTVPFLILLCLPTEAAVVIKNRKLIKETSESRRFIPFILLGLVLGTFFLKNIPNPDLIRILGILIALVALYYMFFENRIRSDFSSPFWQPVIGAMSGLLGGVYSISGPPLIIYFKARKVDKSQFRALLLYLFLFMSIFRLIIYLAFQLFTLPILMSSLICLPFVALGLLSGSFLHRFIPEKLFKIITSLVLLISGIILFI